MAKSKYPFRETPAKGRAVIMDTETTGLSPKFGHRIVEIAAVEVVDGQKTGRQFHSYINPQRSVPPEAIAVHGLTNAFLKDKPVFAAIAKDLIDFIGTADIWFHNAPFDKKFLEAELDMAGHRAENTILCSLKLARALLGKGTHTLSELARKANFTWTGTGAHSAINDTNALAHVLATLLWPLETERALAPPPSPSPRAATRPTPAALSTVQTECVDVTDPRIMRYDGMNLNGKLHSRGAPWGVEETQALCDRFVKEGLSIPNLVQLHGRTPGALFMRLAAAGAIPQDHPYART